MSSTLSSRPLAYAEPGERVEYLKKVLAWTFGGLTLAGMTGFGMAAFLYISASMGITLFLNSWVSLAIIIGSYAIAQWVAPTMVFGNNKVLGFTIGAAFEGIAMGYLLLAAMMMGASQGNPLGLVTMALMMTGLTALGMTAYVWTGPREFSFIAATLSALSLPMLILMGVGLVFPSMFGGPFGLIISAVFVVISAAGLLYRINHVFHKLDTRQHIEGAFLVMMGVLVLFWNILVLLMKLNRRR